MPPSNCRWLDASRHLLDYLLVAVGRKINHQRLAHGKKWSQKFRTNFADDPLYFVHVFVFFSEKKYALSPKRLSVAVCRRTCSECVRMTSSAGQYVYVSPGRDDVCGLFIVGSVNQVVAVEFTDFDVDCDDGGLLVVRRSDGRFSHSSHLT